MRQYTNQELHQFIEAESGLRDKGLIVDDEDGKAFVEHNAERISAYFDLNPQTPINVQTVLKACEQMRSQMHWKSPAQMEYDAVYALLTPAEKDTFGAWWFSPSTKKTILIDGEEGFSNAAKILKWMRGKSFTAQNFHLAISNLASTHGSLYWAQTPKQPDPRQHSGDASFMKKSDTNLTARDHAARRTADAASASGNKPAPATDYRKLAESVTTGRTHSDSLRLQKFFVIRPGTSEIDWQETYLQRKRIADGKAR